ncbi:phenylacetate-CoA oxygenase, PaaK subunit [Marinomonas sp. MED121]|uniref:1,2-phenylacetyl-CoA epoxidase subunit PaaE n=1 Tax=Marinomonas sp. MED121 TaxID=314277 RepID=UPI000068FA63|nr:1,2-phenylacetyl-CoA epoxidase subunit PaaE [Marinomonas sp. MED121]EAQ64138.1 phenylacetate-CoA oxygenase, PaaK subunit [Marinomonas sp. MED121]
MNKFYPLTINKIQRETREAVSITFSVPNELEHKFKYQQGQYLVFKKEIHGQDVRRSYSICSSVNDEQLRIGIKQVPEGLFSSYANHGLKVGDSLEVMPPQGRFGLGLDLALEQERAKTKHFLAVAAGSGITPILSIIKTALEKDENSHITLMYGNRSTASAMFRNELEDLKNAYMDRFNLVFIFSRETQDINLYNGRIDADKCQVLLQRLMKVDELAGAFICGPQSMTEQVAESLEELGLDNQKIHFELFHTESEAKDMRQANRANQSALATEMSEITVIHDGRQMDFELAHNDKTILDAGNDIGADLPYSCTAGVCSTCKAKVLEGEVEMDVNFALEDYEVEAGYVLSCQCYPISSKVVLSYDH